MLKLLKKKCLASWNRYADILLQNRYYKIKSENNFEFDQDF